MYVPKHFSEDDPSELAGFMAASPFAVLVTSVDGTPLATHLPLLFRPQDGEHGCLYGHLAKANSHWRHLLATPESLAVFTGPNAYVSPNWLGSANAVPTWNYVAVHAYGRPRIVDDENQVLAILAWLTAAHESERTGLWTADKMDPTVLRKMLKGIVAFEMPVERIEGKRKMSQNKPADARRGAVRGLRQMRDPQSLAVAGLMEGHVNGDEKS